MLESGALLGGRYRLDEHIATGGMGDVWRGTDVVLGRPVAVKVLLPTLLSDADFIARFRAEARMLATLHHPGVVQVYDYGEDTLPTGRTDYLVMEYVDGEPLSTRIRHTGQLSIIDTLRMVTQVAQALHAAHNGGIVHRDVKPSNLLVQADGTVRLLDFGVARSVDITSITSTNAVPGTALYMAPEQASGQPVSAATDIYALGAVAYQCVTGEPPFTGDNPLQVAVKHVHEEPAPLPAEVPAVVADLIGRALAKDPADRYPNAAAFAAAARAAAKDPEVASAAVAGAAENSIAPAGATAGAGSAALRLGRGPSTLTDNPVVTPPGDRSGEPGPGVLTLAGIAAVVGLTAAAITAVIAFRHPDRAPATNGPPSPTPGGNASSWPSVPEQSSGTAPGGRSETPSRPRQSSQPSASATSSPTPSSDTGPSIGPSGSEGPTNPVPTSSPTGNPPPSGGGPVDPDQG